MTGFRSPLGLAMLLLPPAIVVAAVVLIARSHGFDGLYGQDAFAYADYALGPLRDALAAGRPLPDFPLPPGYPLLIALASFVAGPSDGLGQAVSLVAGAAVPVLVALLTLELWPGADRRVALLAGLITAVAGQLWQSSGVAMSDTPALAIATAGALAACRFHRTGRARWALVAAAALALAVEIRLAYGVVAAVFAILVLARLVADARVAGARMRTIGVGVGAIAVGLLVLAPMLGPIVGALANGQPAPFLVELGVARFDPLTAVRSTFDTADGHLEYRLPMAAWLAIQPFQPYWLGILALAVPIGVLDLIRSRPISAVLATTLIAWPLAMAAVLVTYPYQNPRFVLAMLPPLAILAACGIASVWERAQGPRPKRFVEIVVVAALLVGAAGAWLHADSFAARQAADLAAIRELEAQIPGGATVISLGATAALRHDGLDVVELYYLSPAVAHALIAAGPTYVIVQGEVIKTQWAGTTPGLTIERLRATPGFESVDDAGSWTLFVVPGRVRI